MQLINWELAGNPVNWVIVALMLAIAVMVLNLILDTPPGSVAMTGSAGL